MAPTTETKEREGRIHPGFAAMAGLDLIRKLLTERCNENR